MTGATAPDALRVGAVFRWAHRYRPADLALFAELSGQPITDGGPTYLPDLLVIAPLTKLGGDLNYISRQMSWTAHRVLRPDERVEAELEITSVDDRGGTVRIAFDARIRDETGDVVLDGTSNGVIMRPRP